MKRIAAVASLALALASSAGADVFRVLPNAPTVGVVLPSAELPNGPGSIVFPATLRSRPLFTRTLSYGELLALWQRAGAEYGVPWQVLAAINKIESNFGRNMGPSSAGAVGWMQFMPSTWERWGLDADGDGIADPWNAEDAVTAAARYLAASGGRSDIARAVFSYNHAQWYVDEVLQLSQLFGAGGVDATFSLDRLQISLEQARGALVDANERLLAAQQKGRGIAARERKLRRLLASTELLSDRFPLERRVAQASVAHAVAEAVVDRLRISVRRAENDLGAAQDASQASAFSPAAGALLGAPSYDASYVFPVGGGPALVSVSHHHHDYPAADIAAPAGSPVYALSDAVVQRSWQYPDARCGIGLTLRTSDGQTWTYCHLSYLDPAVTSGTALAGGTQIGLVGSTGDATGPHLHLQLDPVTSYPQLQPWFQRFADVAFRWQDAGPADAAQKQGRIFTVVPPKPAQPSGSVILFTR
jgi:murein DD-endopeptidase MepM/ murein hydrolase activator NlpD